ncbi:filamentous hemagglutinin N-terminal domain-containing protein [Mucisphaera sp.]|uniref:two-partner secretion domain-containing protein n=1 Tax=Mucisphaera sp. TaxID=2913024 RepID=UPI003D0F2E9A
MSRPRLSEGLIWRYVSRRVPFAVAMAVAAGVGGSEAVASPEVNQVVAGNVSVAQQGALTEITASNNSIINYNSFNIAVDETVRFVQPNAQARVFNRVVGPGASQIDGRLEGNGRVYLVNPNGIFFGSQAVVNVGELHAAAGRMTNQDFLNGVESFTALGGVVRNEGMIQADVVSLLGRRVENLGTIVAPQGTITMAAGDSVLITRLGSTVMAKIDASAVSAAQDAAVLNEGTLEAQGGMVRMGAGDVFALAVRQNGVVKASEVVVEGEGRVELDGEVLTDGGSFVATGRTLSGSGLVDTTGVEGDGLAIFAATDGTLTLPEVVAGDVGVESDVEVIQDQVLTASGLVRLTQTDPTGRGVRIQAGLEASGLVVDSATNLQVSAAVATDGGVLDLRAGEVLGLTAGLSSNGGDILLTGGSFADTGLGSIDGRGASGDGRVGIEMEQFASLPTTFSGDLQVVSDRITVGRSVVANGSVDLTGDQGLTVTGLGSIVSTGEAGVNLLTDGTLVVRGLVRSDGGVLMGARAYQFSGGGLIDAGDGSVAVVGLDTGVLRVGDGLASSGEGDVVFGTQALERVSAGRLVVGSSYTLTRVGHLVDGETGEGLAAGTDLVLWGREVEVAGLAGGGIDLGSGVLEIEGVDSVEVLASLRAEEVSLAGDAVGVSAGVVGSVVSVDAGVLTMRDGGSLGEAGTTLVGVEADRLALLNGVVAAPPLVEADSVITPAVFTGDVVALSPVAGGAIALDEFVSGDGFGVDQALLDRIDARELRIGRTDSGALTLGAVTVHPETALVLRTGGSIEVGDTPAAVNVAGASSLVMEAVSGIGSELAVTTDVSDLTARTLAGGIRIENLQTLTALDLDAGLSDISLNVAGDVLDGDLFVDLRGGVAELTAGTIDLLQTRVSTLRYNGVDQGVTGTGGRLSVVGDITGFAFASTLEAALIEATGSIFDLVLEVPEARVFAGGDIVSSRIDATGLIELIAGGDIDFVEAAAGTRLIARAGGQIINSRLTAGESMHLEADSIGTPFTPLIVDTPVLTGESRNSWAHFETPGYGGAASDGMLSVAFKAMETMRVLTEMSVMQSGDWVADTVEIDAAGGLTMNGLVSASGSNTILLSTEGVMTLTGDAVLDSALAGGDIVMMASGMEIEPGARLMAGEGRVAMIPMAGMGVTLGADAEGSEFQVGQGELDMVESASEILVGSMDSVWMRVGSVDTGEIDLMLESGGVIDEIVDDNSVKLRTAGRLTMVAGAEIGRDPEGDGSTYEEADSYESGVSAYEALDIEVARLDVFVTGSGKVSLEDVGGLTVEEIYTTSGDIYLVSTGEIVALDVTANSDIQFTSQTGGIAVGRMQASEGVNLSAVNGNIVAAAGVPVQQIVAPTTSMTARSVGTAATPVQTAVGQMSVTTTGNQNLAQTGSLNGLNLNAGGGSVNLNVAGSVLDGDPGVDLSGRSISVTADAFGAPSQPLQVNGTTLEVDTSASNGWVSVQDVGGNLRSANLKSGSGGIQVETNSPGARITTDGGGPVSLDQPLDVGDDLPDEATAEEPDGPGIDFDEPLWVVGDFAEREGWLADHELLRDLSEAWGERLAFYIEQALQARGERTAGVSEEVSDAEMRTLIAQGLEFFCQGLLERLELEEGAGGEPIAKLTLVYELQKNVSNHLTLVQKKRLRTRNGSEPMITAEDLDDLLQLAAERIVDRIIDDAPTGMMGVRG